MLSLMRFSDLSARISSGLAETLLRIARENTGSYDHALHAGIMKRR